jgi:hypothetical protein
MMVKIDIKIKLNQIWSEEIKKKIYIKYIAIKIFYFFFILNSNSIKKRDKILRNVSIRRWIACLIFNW